MITKIYRNNETTYDLHVMWSIHNRCNYSCSYCPDELHNGSSSWLKLDDLKYFVEVTLSHYKIKLGAKNILFSFTGGEPTLWRDFKPFVKYLGERDIRVGLTTNGSVSTNFWDGIVDYFDYICLSFHTESADAENFIEKYKYFHNNKKCVVPSVRVMMHKNNELWNKALKVIEGIKKYKNHTIECVHILENYGTSSEKISYEDPKKEIFMEKNSFLEQYKKSSLIPERKLGFEDYQVENDSGDVGKLYENDLINKDQVNFSGWECAIGIEQLFVHFNGGVKTSGCEMGKEIGNILYPEFIDFPVKPVICKVKNCYCPTDVRITKSLTHSFQKDKNIEIIKPIEINTQERFKYRLKLHISVSELDLMKTMLLLKKMNNIVDNIKKQYDLSEKRVLLEISFEGSDNSKKNKDICKLIFKNLSFLKCVKRMSFDCREEIMEQVMKNIKEFYSLYIEISNGDYIDKVDELFDVVKSVGHTLKVVPVIMNHVKITENFCESLISLINNKNRYYELTVGTVEQLEKVNKYFIANNVNPIQLHSINHSSYEEARAINTAQRFSIDHVDILMSDKTYNSLSKYRSEFQEEKLPFKGWECNIGKMGIIVNSKGDVFTSTCPQTEKIGNLFDSDINEKILCLGPVVCKQDFCTKEEMQLIQKKIIS